MIGILLDFRMDARYVKQFLLCIILLITSGAWTSVHAQAPEEGARITNRAVATYFDTGSGYNMTLESNFVTVVVNPLPGIQLVDDRLLYRPPGASVAYPHVLTNIGNVQSSYTLQVNNLSTDDFDIVDLEIFRDLNGNGQADAGETQLTPTDQILLNRDESVDLVVTGSVPLSAVSGTGGDIDVIASIAGSSESVQNRDRVVISGGALVELDKAVNEPTPTPGSEVIFTLTARNSGNAPAGAHSIFVDGALRNFLLIRDPLPANVEFLGFVSIQNATPLYHVNTAPSNRYSSILSPSDFDLIDEIAFGLPELAVNQTVTVSFRVRVNENASGTIENIANLLYNDGVQVDSLIVNSNGVEIQLPEDPPELEYFDEDYQFPANVASLGDPLFLEADASRCNTRASVVDTVEITLRSTLTGDVEQFSALETEPNSGRFRIQPNVPTRDASLFSPDSYNGIMETTQNDRLLAELSGCGAGLASTFILIEPSGVVYDSKTDRLIEGATVTLIDITGGGNGGDIGGPANVFAADGTTQLENSIVTGPDGRFSFPLVQESRYKIVVLPPQNYSYPSILPPDLLPSGHITILPASYGGEFDIGQQFTSVQLDIPLDQDVRTGLFIAKEASKNVVEIADFVDYTIKLSNSSGGLLGQVTLNDTLPTGFVYLNGTSRFDGQKIDDPSSSGGNDLQWLLGSIDDEATVDLTYRVRIGPGAARGDGINTAQAFSAPPLQKQSNIAAKKVRVSGGIFSDDGFIAGKVFLDCNANGVQENDEKGISDIRLYLEDGTYVMTDNEGNYTFYGINPRTHVLKLDYSTLPSGATLNSLQNRNAGDPGSRFVDLKNGELHKADFAVCNCSPGVVSEVDGRRLPLDNRANELDRSLRTPLNPDGSRRVAGDLKRLSASGIVGSEYDVTEIRTHNLEKKDVNATSLQRLPLQRMALGDLLIDANNEPAFLDIKSGDTLKTAQSNIRIKGKADGEVRLLVNGRAVDKGRIGEEVAVVEQQLMAREYIDVKLKPGANRLRIEEYDNFNNARNSREITVYAPNRAGQLAIYLDESEVPADGYSMAEITIVMQDAESISVTGRTPVTIEWELGIAELEDLDPREPGAQVFIEGGKLRFSIQSPIEPGSGRIRVKSGEMSAETEVTFLPDLRPLIAVGLIDGVFNLNNLDKNSVSTSALDGFEREIRELAWNSSDGKQSGGARAALYLKGKVKGDALLTVAYDSEKETDERLFRDIQPDEYYPVYGESSLRGYDAQSTSKLYVRLDKKKSYLLFGDYVTQDRYEGRQLSLYNRSMTGLKGFVDNESVQLSAFGSRDNATQTVEELPARGISGPYELQQSDLIENSEKIELLTRDRNQPGIVLRRVPMVRFRDYVLEPFTGRILFRSPVPSLDADLNPIVIRVVYEAEGGGDSFWSAGVDGSVKIADGVHVGGMFVEDQNPADSLRLIGAHTAVQLSDKTMVYAEYLSTKSSSTGKGEGARAEIRHNGEKLRGRIFAGRTDENFVNPSATFSGARAEAGLKGTVMLGDKTRLNAESVFTEDISTGGNRKGAHLFFEQKFARNSSLELGARYTYETRAGASPGSVSAGEENTSIRAKVSSQIPGAPRLNVFGEYEQVVSNSEKKVVAMGGNYQFHNSGRLYARHEFVSSLNSRYALNSTQEQHSTVVGLDSDYMTGGRVFSEYRIRDAIAGRDAQAAMGLRNQWSLSSGLRFNTSFERIFTLDGNAESEATSATMGLEYLPNNDWKTTGRFEIRNTRSNRTYLNTVGLAYKMSPSWTLLGRNVLSLTNAKNDVNDQTRNWMRFGLAYRDIDNNNWMLLTRYEIKYTAEGAKSQQSQQLVHLISTHLHAQASRSMMISTRYAGKLVRDDFAGSISRAKAHLAAIRTTQDLGKRFDVGLLGSMLIGDSFKSRSYAFGGELGFRLTTNVWLSAGYNVTGFRDEDLSRTDYTDKGMFARLRIKFDEGLFNKAMNRRDMRNAAAYKECAPYIPPVEKPKPKKKEKMIEVPAIELPDRVHFALDRWKVTEKSQAVLDTLVRFLKANPEAYVVLSGHTDSRAEKFYNAELGNKRALSVKFYLFDQGIKAHRIDTRTEGELVPITGEQTVMDKARNRRVMIVIESEHKIKLVPQEADLHPER